MFMFFSCDGKMFYTGLFAIIVTFFYIKKTEELKRRTRKHKSDVIPINNSNCKKCKKRCYIMNLEPQLMSYNK